MVANSRGSGEMQNSGSQQGQRDHHAQDPLHPAERGKAFPRPDEEGSHRSDQNHGGDQIDHPRSPSAIITGWGVATYGF